MVVARPFLLAVAHVHRLAGAADHILMVQLLRIEHGFVDQAPVDRGDHLQARRDIDVHAVDADDVDLLRLGLMHSAQLGEAVRLLVLHRDAGLLGEWVAECPHDRLLPGAAVAEIGDRPLGSFRARRERDQRREQRGAGGARGERPQEVATSETASLQQESAQARTGLVHIFACIGPIAHGFPPLRYLSTSFTYRPSSPAPWRSADPWARAGTARRACRDTT